MDTFDIKYLIGCWDVIFVLLFQGGNTLARPRGPRFKVARRFGVNVCAHPKALKRGATQVRKQSDYGKQLNEKQKLKAYYDMQEKQFANWVEAAMSAKGNAGENLVQRLECRLDNLVYRLGFGSTLRQARQMVVHHHILVNGKRVDRPSYEVKVGDVISLRERSQSIDTFKNNFKESLCNLSYLQKDENNLSGKLVALPSREEVPIEVTDSLIIEYYSK
ncbi:ribosomal protein S4 [Filifactor alocis ATCC 35896]|uniref:Small ribosomal subunit protein uS4 n=1 Tax=Filifactor alocis (strain ATCC 35896 / CCUG 47790 / D40 B5) TaxID=546269 RepID=D6GQZ3_FILAD|nr:ribosomal protein S4 [Filifactor alocis ATCC 35896]